MKDQPIEHALRKQRIALSTYWLVWSRGIIRGVALLSTLVVIRLLDPSDYGLMALAGIWTGMAMVVIEMGLGNAIVQFPDLEERELNACFWLIMSIAGLGYLALYAAAPAIAEWFNSPRLSDVLRVAAVSLLFVSVGVVPDSLLRKRLLLDKVSQAEIAGKVITVPVVITLAWGGAGVWALVAGIVVMPLVKSLVTYWFVRWKPGLQIGGQRLRKVISYSLTTLGNRLCWEAYSRADIFVLAKVSGDVALGSYSIAKEGATFPVTNITAVVNKLAFPVMAGLQDNPDAIRQALLRAIRLVTCATFPLCIGIMILGEDLVRIVLTDKWIAAVPVLQVLSLYALIRSVVVLFSPVLKARYRHRFLLGYALVLLGIMPPAFLVGAWWSGAVGVAVAWVAAYPVVMVWMAREAFREINLSWSTFGKQLHSPMLATLAMTVSMLAVQWVVSSWGADLAIWRLLLSSLVGALVYAGSLIGLGGPILSEIKEVAGWLIRRRRPVSGFRRTTHDKVPGRSA